MYTRLIKGHTGLKLLSLTTGLYFFGDQYFNKNRRSCGIVGYCGVKKQATKFTLDGIQLLQNRGYDSAGICTVNDENEFILTKFASNTSKNLDCIETLSKVVPKKHGESHCGIGHTRWATCGGKTDENAHPHLDQKERIALVHNGTVENVDELRKELISKGVVLKSQTDTEIIAQVIGQFMDSGKTLLESAKEAFSTKILGTWGIVIVSKDSPDKIVVCRNGSPLLIASNDDAIFVASEQIALEKYANNFFHLNDMEILELDVNNRKDLLDIFKTRVQKINKVNAQLTPKPQYDYFYIQEIKEQPEALLKCLNYGGRLAGEKGTPKLGGLELQAEKIMNIEHMLIVACGTSYYAGLYVQRIFKQLGCFETIQTYEATEIHESDFPQEKGGLIVVSQSGETHDVKKAISIAKEKGFLTIGVVNVVGSTISRLVDCGVYTNCGREVAVAATKSFSCQLLALVLISIWITHRKCKDQSFLLRQEILKSLHQIPSYVGKTLLKIKDNVLIAAQQCYKDTNLFILGKHQTYPIAKEAALKTKEITYIHTEGYSIGDFVNQSIYLLSESPEQPSKNDNLQEHIRILNKLKEHNSYIIVVTDCLNQIPQQLYDLSIEVPSIGLLTGFLCVLPFHLFSYEVCKLLGRNPDKPRNLAKTVTVA